jgi:hypothetical protein
MGNVARMGKNINQNGLGGGTWLCKYRPRWEDNVKASLKELVWEGMVRINVA